jgi:hypothetical protein
MSARWWKNERSLLASRVRATRARLRASYRRQRAADQRVANETATSTAQLILEAAARRVAAERARADHAVEAVYRVGVRIYPWSHGKELQVRVQLSHEVLARTDRAALLAAVAEQIGRGVEQKVRAADLGDDAKDRMNGGEKRT